jgi:hypothetical protein
LDTFLLLIAVAAVLAGLYAQSRREEDLRAALTLYRNPKTEGIIDALSGPDLLSAHDDSTLEAVLKELNARTTRNPNLPKIPAGIPIYVDPIGLQEAEMSLSAQIKRTVGDASADASLGQRLRLLLDAVGLSYQVKYGYLMITSKESLDVALEDVDPYLRYRDVLR